MKKFIFLLAISISNLSMSYDDYDIEDQVQAAGFLVGSDKDLGGVFFYIVDKTNNLCFAGINMQMSANGGSAGMTAVDCEKLKSTPKIKKFLQGLSIN